MYALLFLCGALMFSGVLVGIGMFVLVCVFNAKSVVPKPPNAESKETL